jgi:UDP-GlcNAc3NAcA epimerase
MTLKIVSVVGARPQFIKAATLSRAIAGTTDVTEHVIHTGQHYDDNMSEVFFREMKIPPPATRLQFGSLGHGAMTGRMLESIEKVLLEVRPDATLVYGDTNSTAAGALAASKLSIPVIHVEAGLRSFNRKMPEELNRIVADHLSDLMFAPTDRAMSNLANEGLADKAIRTGDVMLDASLFYRAQIGDHCPEELKHLGSQLDQFALVTVHRAESVDDDVVLTNILRALALVAKDISLIFPLHPRTKGRVEKLFPEFLNLPGVNIVQPLGFLAMLYLEGRAKIVVTDSGGVQKEAYFFSVPCVTLRAETEWVELVEAGANVLCPPAQVDDLPRIIQASLKAGFKGLPGLYGVGTTADDILLHIRNFLNR